MSKSLLNKNCLDENKQQKNNILSYFNLLYQEHKTLYKNQIKHSAKRVQLIIQITRTERNLRGFFFKIYTLGGGEVLVVGRGGATSFRPRRLS